MGYAFNVVTSIPMAFILWMLTDRGIRHAISDDTWSSRHQKKIIISFIFGVVYCVIAATLVAEKSNAYNQALQLALYGAGSFIIADSMIFKWDRHAAGTQVIILFMAMIGFIAYTYRYR